jgi:hypothetical protein
MEQGRIMKTPFIYCSWDCMALPSPYCLLMVLLQNYGFFKRIYKTYNYKLSLIKKDNIMQIITKQKSLDIRGNLLGLLEILFFFSILVQKRKTKPETMGVGTKYEASVE